MARDDPKARKDIRNDGRHIPQEHHSSRGSAPRNSGNLTRGSQLLNTQVLMWLQGAKLPFLMSRGGRRKAGGEGSDGGRGDTVMAQSSAEETPNIATDFAANILTSPTKGNSDTDRGLAQTEATARVDSPTPKSEETTSTADSRINDSHKTPMTETTAGRVTEHSGGKAVGHEPRDQAEDISIREARDAFDVETGL